MSRNLNMTRGSPLRLLLVFALPLMLGNVFQQLYTVTDTAIVGRGVGMDALAALGCVDWITWLLFATIQGFTQGFSVMVSQKFGEGDADGLRKTVGCSAALAAVITLAVGIPCFLLIPVFLRLLRVPAALTPMGRIYLRIMYAGIPCTVLYNFCASMLRAVGNSAVPLLAMVAASVSNILLDLAAVFVLRWGIAGAAAATVVSQLLSGVVCLLYIVRKCPELHFSLRDSLRELSRRLLPLLRLGLPTSLMNVVIGVGGLAVQAIVNGFGTSFIAGVTATNKLYGLLEIAALSYGYAVTTYTGQNYGASDLDRVKRGMRTASVLALLTAAAIGGAMILGGRAVTGLFISADDAEQAAAAGATAYRYLCFMSGGLPILYILYVSRSALQGLGSSVIPMISGVMEMFLRVGVALTVSRTGQPEGIFTAEPAAWTGAAVILFVSYCVSVRRIERGRRPLP